MVRRASTSPLHLITDPALPAEQLADIAAAAVAGGVDAVQVRLPGGREADVRALLTLLRQRLGAGALLLVNGRLRLAQEGLADGVHLSERSPALTTARHRLGADMPLGVSVHSLAAALLAEAVGASYVTFGHVFPTMSHPNEPARGLEALRTIAMALRVPVLAIGGITPERVAAVRAAGAAGVAVMRAISAAADPAEATRQLRAALDGAPGRMDRG